MTRGSRSKRGSSFAGTDLLSVPLIDAKVKRVDSPLFCGRFCSFNILLDSAAGEIAVDVRHKCSLVSYRKFVAEKDD